MNSQDNLITVEKYFEYLSKENLTPFEEVKIESFEQHIRFSMLYEEYLSDAAQSILTKYYSKMLTLRTKENRTERENLAVSEYEMLLAPEENEKQTLNQDGPSRSLKLSELPKAGYIDAAIILAMVLNIGFIVAMTILGR